MLSLSEIEPGDRIVVYETTGEKVVIVRHVMPRVGALLAVDEIDTSTGNWSSNTPRPYYATVLLRRAPPP